MGGVLPISVLPVLSGAILEDKDLIVLAHGYKSLNTKIKQQW